jgi:predicted DNA-binding ribbon-helix-helix protein
MCDIRHSEFSGAWLRIAVLEQGGAAMNSTVKKRSIIIRRQRTSISLEDDFWACIRQIARERATTASELIGVIDAGRGNGSNLSSAIRVFVLDHYRNASTTLPCLLGQSGELNDQNARPSVS